MSESIEKIIKKSGTKITKERLFELLRKNSVREYAYTQLSNSKIIVVIIE